MVVRMHRNFKMARTESQLAKEKEKHTQTMQGVSRWEVPSDHGRSQFTLIRCVRTRLGVFTHDSKGAIQHDIELTKTCLDNY